MEYSTSKVQKSYISGTHFFVNTYRNKSTVQIKTESIMNTDELNMYIQNPLDIEKWIEQFTSELLDKEEELSFPSLDVPCLYQNVVVMLYGNDDYGSGESKVVKFAYSSPVYVIKKLEKKSFLKMISNINIKQAFDYVESGSGWRLIALDLFKSQLLTNVKEDKIMKMRNEIIGSIERKKTRSNFNPFSKHNVDALIKYLIELDKEENIITTNTKTRSDFNPFSKHNVNALIKYLIELDKEENINTTNTKTRSDFNPFSKHNVNALIKYLKQLDKEENCKDNECSELMGPWCRPRMVWSDNNIQNGKVLHFQQKQKMFLDFSSIVDKGYCFYAALLIGMLLNKIKIRKVKDFDHWETENTVGGIKSEEEVFEFLKKGLKEEDWIAMKNFLIFIKNSCYNLTVQNLESICMHFTNEGIMFPYHLRIFVIKKKINRLHLIGNNLKVINIYEDYLNPIFESKLLNPLQLKRFLPLLETEEKDLLNGQFSNTINILIANQGNQTYHALNLINLNYSKKLVSEKRESKRYLKECPRCLQFYSNEGNKKRHETTCEGFYDNKCFLYSPKRTFYKPRTKFMMQSRRQFPFFITFDCETLNIPYTGEKEEKQKTLSHLTYFCHTVSLNIVSDHLAKKLFGLNVQENVIKQLVFYYENNDESLKKNIIDLLPVPIQHCKNIIAYEYRQKLWREMSQCENLKVKENLKSDLIVYDLLLLAAVVKNYCNQVLLKENSSLNISSEDYDYLWQPDEIICTICKKKCNKLKAENVKNRFCEIEIEKRYNQKEIDYVNYSHESLADLLYEWLSEVNLFALSDSMQNLIQNENTSKIKQRLLFLTQTLYLLKKWILLIETYGEGYSWQNGYMCKIINMNMDEVMNIIRWLGKLFLTQRRYDILFEEDMIFQFDSIDMDLFLLEDSRFLFKTFLEIFRVMKTLLQSRYIHLSENDKVNDIQLFSLLSDIDETQVKLWHQVLTVSLKSNHADSENVHYYEQHLYEKEFQKDLQNILKSVLYHFENYLVVDHDHYTGEVLGLAHNLCNVSYGKVSSHNILNIYAHNSVFDNAVMIINSLHKTLDFPLHDLDNSTSSDYENLMKYFTFDNCFFIAQNSAKIRIVDFYNKVRIVDSYRLMNMSLNEATSMLTSKCKNDLITSAVSYFYQYGFLDYESMTHLLQNESLKSCLTKKLIFPYSQLELHLLEKEYESIPPIELFAKNDLSKSATLEEEMDKIKTDYENVKLIWNFFKIKNLKTLLKIYVVIDSLSLGMALIDFDNKTFVQTGFHILSAVSIFSFASHFNNWMSGINVQHPPTHEHHQLIEKCVRGGMSTNGSFKLGINTDYYKDYLKLNYIKNDFDTLMFFADENQQYGGAQTGPLICQMNYHLDYDTKDFNEVLNKYYTPLHRLEQFSTDAFVHCKLSMKKEYQDKCHGFSPMVQRGHIPLYQYSPYEILKLRKKLNNGQYTIEEDKSVKLLMKVDSHVTVETLDYLKWLVEERGVVIEEIYSVMPVYRYPLSAKSIHFYMKMRAEALKIGDLITAALCKFIVNGQYGFHTRKPEKNINIKIYVHTQEKLRQCIKNLNELYETMISEGVSPDEFKQCLPQSFQKFFFVNGQFMTYNAEDIYLDLNNQKISSQENPTLPYDSFFKEFLATKMKNLNTKSVVCSLEGDNVDVLNLLVDDVEINLKKAVVTLVEEKSKKVNLSLRMIAAKILSNAKLNISRFVFDLQNMCEKHQASAHLMVTDTDSACFMIMREKSDNFNLNDEFQQWIKNDDQFNPWMDFSNYPKDHFNYNNDYAKAPHHFQDEVPPKAVINKIMAMAPKCYMVDVDKEGKLSTKKRFKGVPLYNIKMNNYVNGLDCYPCTNHIMKQQWKNMISKKDQHVLQNRMGIKRSGEGFDIAIKECKLQLFKKPNQKLYPFDCGVMAEIRGHHVLKPLEELNKTVLPNKNAFCSDNHIEQLIRLEHEIIKNHSYLKRNRHFIDNTVLPFYKLLKNSIYDIQNNCEIEVTSDETMLNNECSMSDVLL